MGSAGRMARIERKLEGTGLVVATHSPGDGTTRYKFGRPSESGDSYFALTRSTTVLGIREAEAFAAGVAAAQEVA